MKSKKSRNLKQNSGSQPFQCSQCGSCCCEPVPLVTHHDIRRLVKATGLPADRLVTLYLHVDLDDEEYWIRMRNGKRVMGLRKVKGKCIFLSEDHHCTVYNSRPMSCRIYPFDLTIDDNNRLDDIKLQKSSRSSVRCSFRYSKSASAPLLQHIAKQDFAMTASYRKKVSLWNRLESIGRKREFLSFIGL